MGWPPQSRCLGHILPSTDNTPWLLKPESILYVQAPCGTNYAHQHGSTRLSDSQEGFIHPKVTPCYHHRAAWPANSDTTLRTPVHSHHQQGVDGAWRGRRTPHARNRPPNHSSGAIIVSTAITQHADMPSCPSPKQRPSADTLEPLALGHLGTGRLSQLRLHKVSFARWILC